MSLPGVGAGVGMGVEVHLTKDQPNAKAAQMSSWPGVVPLLATRCLKGGYIWAKVSLTQRLPKCQADLK